jgi:hypothetical protein
MDDGGSGEQVFESSKAIRTGRSPDIHWLDRAGHVTED